MAQNPLKLKELGERSTRRSLLDSWYGSDYAAVEMAAQGGLTTLGDSIDALSEKLFSAETRRTMQLKREWPAIAGEQLAVLAGFGGFAEGVLALEVRHSAFLRELRELGPEIRARVNAALGGEFCREVRFEPAGSRKR